MTSERLMELIADAVRSAAERDDSENPLRGVDVVETRFLGDTMSMFTVFDENGQEFDVKIVRIVK